MMPLLRFRLHLMRRLLQDVLHAHNLLEDKRNGIVLMVGLVAMTTAIVTAGLVSAGIIPGDAIATTPAKIILLAACGGGLGLVVMGMWTAARITMWPSLLRLTPESLEAYAQSITTTVHSEMMKLRDIVASGTNPPRDAWTFVLRLPSVPATPNNDPFRGASLQDSTQAVTDAYRDALAIYPWRQTLDQELGQHRAHLGLIALHLRGDTTITIPMPAVSAHDALRLAAQRRTQINAPRG